MGTVFVYIFSTVNDFLPSFHRHAMSPFLLLHDPSFTTADSLDLSHFTFFLFIVGYDDISSDARFDMTRYNVLLIASMLAMASAKTLTLKQWAVRSWYNGRRTRCQ